MRPHAATCHDSLRWAGHVRPRARRSITTLPLAELLGFYDSLAPYTNRYDARPEEE